MKRISYLETCHPRNLLSGIHAFVLRLDSRLRGNDSEVVSLHASRFTRCVCFIVFLFLLHASHFTLHAQAVLENGMEAAVVVGQPNFTTANVGTTQTSFSGGDLDVASNGKQMAVSDRGGDRVLIWNSIPTKNHVPADIVLGQPDFTSTGPGTTQTQFSNDLRGIAMSHDKFLVADRGNHRLLIWNSIPTTNLAPADVVVGQPSFTVGSANQGLGVARANTISNPEGLFYDGQKFIVSDRGNSRILIWNSLPTFNNSSADVVIGQPDFVTRTAGVVDDRHLAMDDSDLCTDGKALIHADQPNNRVLIWNPIPTVNYAPADVVLGQPDFSSNTANQGKSPGRDTVRQPLGCAYDGQQLFVADINNNRVLVWNTLPTKNNTPADVVIGQPNFQTVTNGTTASKMSGPHSVVLAGRQLLVADDAGNNRILIFNLGGNAGIDLGPQFSQGKAVVGKVFWDWNGNGRQDHFGPPSQELRRARPASQARRQDA